MTLSLTHTFVSAKADGGDSTLVRPSNWNAEHTITAAACSVLGRSANSSGAVADIAASADGQFLRRAAGAIGFGAIAWSDLPDGVTVNSLTTLYTTSADVGTVLFPHDDTIPQKTEGTEIFNVNWTPKSTTNQVRVRTVLSGEAYIAYRMCSAALFQDSTAGALAGVTGPQAGGANNQAFSAIVLEYVFVPGSTSTTALKIRIGPHVADGMRLNGWNGGRLFGGVAVCAFTIEEIKAS